MFPRLATSSSVPRALFWPGVWPAVFERLLALLGRLSLLGSILALLLFRSSNPSERLLSIHLIDFSAFGFRSPVSSRTTASV